MIYRASFATVGCIAQPLAIPPTSATPLLAALGRCENPVKEATSRATDSPLRVTGSHAALMSRDMQKTPSV
jgi:hypothetical protein